MPAPPVAFDWLLFKRMFKKLPGIGAFVAGHVCRRTGDHDLAPGQRGRVLSQG